MCFPLPYRKETFNFSYIQVPALRIGTARRMKCVTEENAWTLVPINGKETSNNAGQSFPIPLHSQTRAKNADLVTLET